MCLFQAFTPGGRETGDLPLIRKPQVPEPHEVEVPDAAAPERASQMLVATACRDVGSRSMQRQSAPAYTATLDLLAMIDQQLRLLFTDIDAFRGVNVPLPGKPAQEIATPLQPPGEVSAPILCLLSDQASENMTLGAALRCVGARVVSLYDHNHRDDRDAIGGSGYAVYEYGIDLLSRIPNGPWGQGLWFQAMSETRDLLLQDALAMERCGIHTTARARES